MSQRPTKHVIHFNRQREKYGLPWTVHNRGVCHAASHIRIEVPMESEEKPHLKSNPRYFFTCKGYLHWEGTIAVITSSKDRDLVDGTADYSDVDRRTKGLPPKRKGKTKRRRRKS